MVRRSLFGVVLAVAVLCPVVGQEGAIAAPITQAQESELDRAFNEGMRLFQEGSKELGLFHASNSAPKFGESEQVTPNGGESPKSGLSRSGENETALSKESLEKAIDQFQKVLKLSQSSKEQDKKAITLLMLGVISKRLERNQRALYFYEQALPLCEAIKDRLCEANIHTGIGVLHHGSGYSEKSLKSYEKALLILHDASINSLNKVNILVLKATILHNAGGVYSDRRENDKALQYYYDALKVIQTIGDTPEEIVIFKNIYKAAVFNSSGVVYSNLRKHQEALLSYEQSLKFQPLSNILGRATTLSNIGRIHDELGKKQKALRYYNESILLFEQGFARADLAHTLNHIGGVYDDLGDQQTALEKYGKALTIFRDLKNPKGVAINTPDSFWGRSGQRSYPPCKVRISTK